MMRRLTSDSASTRAGSCRAIDQKIGNDEIGDFDQGDPRSLESWVNVISYVDDFKVELVEMDDLSGSRSEQCAELAAVCPERYSAFV